MPVRTEADPVVKKIFWPWLAGSHYVRFCSQHVRYQGACACYPLQLSPRQLWWAWAARDPAARAMAVTKGYRVVSSSCGHWHGC